MEGSCRLGAVMTVPLACACWLGSAVAPKTGSSLSNLDTAEGGVLQLTLGCVRTVYKRSTLFVPDQTRARCFNDSMLRRAGSCSWVHSCHYRSFGINKDGASVTHAHCLSIWSNNKVQTEGL